MLELLDFQEHYKSTTHSSIRDKDLGEGSTMTRRLSAHSLNRMHRCPRRAGRPSKVGREPWRVQARCLAGRHRSFVFLFSAWFKQDNGDDAIRAKLDREGGGAEASCV